MRRVGSGQQRTALPAQGGEQPTDGRLRQALRARHDTRPAEHTYAMTDDRSTHGHSVRLPGERVEPKMNAFLRCQGHDGLHTRAEPGPEGRAESDGPDLGGLMLIGIASPREGGRMRNLLVSGRL